MEGHRNWKKKKRKEKTTATTTTEHSCEWTASAAAMIQDVFMEHGPTGMLYMTSGKGHMRGEKFQGWFGEIFPPATNRVQTQVKHENAEYCMIIFPPIANQQKHSAIPNLQYVIQTPSLCFQRWTAAEKNSSHSINWGKLRLLQPKPDQHLQWTHTHMRKIMP